MKYPVLTAIVVVAIVAVIGMAVDGSKWAKPLGALCFIALLIDAAWHVLL